MEPTVYDCDYYHNSWCTLSDNQCFVGMIDGDECDEFNELKEQMKLEVNG